MEAQKVDMFIMSNGKFLEGHQMNMIRERLLDLDDSKWAMLSTIQFKDPTTLLIVSLLAGGLGIDRFMLGDMGMGLLKLFTFGCCGVLWLIDIFTTKERTGEFNRKKATEIFQSIKHS